MSSKMNPKLREKITESLSAVLPITAIVLLISILLIPMDLGGISLFLTGAFMLIVGMGFFQLGAEMAMTPIGEGIGVGLSKTKSAFLLAFIGFLMGVIITVSEPDLQVLAEQVPAILNWVLILTVALGVGVFLAVAVIRIRYRIELSTLLIVLYVGLIAASFFVPDNFLAVAFDSGGVTTGPMTVPFIMAMGVGLSSVRADKDAASDSFGLVALSSIGPILAVMVLGIISRPAGVEYEATPIPELETTRDVADQFFFGFGRYAEEVAVSLLPIVLMFVFFQIISHRFHKRQLLRIVMGILFTYVGLVLFLCGVNVGFSPVGAHLGEELATSGIRWILVPLGMLIGYFIVKAEPAIQVLNDQVESVTDGAISVKAMNRAMSIGVSVSVGLAMLRILLGFPIQYIVLPGYLLALVLTRFVPKIFVGIAFDSGGVASGPMTSTFLIPLSIGTCQALGGNIMTDAFGVVALVALTPLIAVQLMGLIYRIRVSKHSQSVEVGGILPADCDVILDFEEA